MKIPIEIGDQVKCIKKSFTDHTPKTIIGKIYTVTELSEYGICLKETDPMCSTFRFDIARFEKVETKEQYPTLNSNFFNKY